MFHWIVEVVNLESKVNVNVLLNAIADHQSVMTSLITNNHPKKHKITAETKYH